MTFGLPVEAEPLRLFGAFAYWLRAYPQRTAAMGSLSEGSWDPHLQHAHINAARALGGETFEQEVVGSGTGEHNLSFTLIHEPVLPQTLELRVREELTEEEERAFLAGPRAPEDPELIAEYPERSIPGKWYLWKPIDSFVGVPSDARVYRVDGPRVVFGGREGKALPPGIDNVRAIRYRTGAIQGSEVAPYALTKLNSTVESVEVVSNPVEASGQRRATQSVASAAGRFRSQRQLISPRDIEAALVEGFSTVVRARVEFPPGSGGRLVVWLVLRTRVDERRRLLTESIRSGFRAQLLRDGWGGLEAERIAIEDANYQRFEVVVTVKPTSVGVRVAAEQATRQRLQGLLHPVTGGPDGEGWPLGRTLDVSDVLRSLSDIEEIDRVVSVTLNRLSEDGHRFETDGPTEFPSNGVVWGEQGDVTVDVTLSKEA